MTVIKRTSVNTSDLITEAWAYLWKSNHEEQAKGKPTDYGYASYFYVTASDVENQVRLFLREDLQGKRRGTLGRAMGRDYGGGLKVSGDLNGRVRDWLLHNPNIDRHNFGRGHISGMRFRPRGAPISPQEEKTIERKGRARPVHFRSDEKRRDYGFKPLCMAGRKSRPNVWGRPSRRHVYSTTEREKVTCRQCINRLSEGAE